MSISQKIIKFAHMTTEEFISKHRNDDVRSLALQGARRLDIDMPYALDQIAGWQTARTKLPSWAVVNGLVYPPHLSMEQCSSEQTARYKANLASRLLCDINAADGTRLVDLTGGFGVDFSFMAHGFDRMVYVERLPHLCESVRHNLPLLGLPHAEVVEGDGTVYLQKLDHATLIFLDPARRDSHGGKTVAISDCTPNVATLEKMLLDKADLVMLKLSPMLDWHKAVSDLDNKVSEVHIVSVGGECKELLLVLRRDFSGNPLVVCVNDDDAFSYREGSPLQANMIGTDNNPPMLILTSTPEEEYCDGNVPQVLLVPNASIMKAGCFDRLVKTFGVRAVSDNSHLFLAADVVEDFPCKQYRIERVTSLNKKEIRKALTGIDRANISARNFPLSVPELRKRLKVKDGGDIHIFATTRDNREHVLYICSRL